MVEGERAVPSGFGDSWHERKRDAEDKTNNAVKVFDVLRAFS